MPGIIELSSDQLLPFVKNQCVTSALYIGIKHGFKLHVIEKTI